MAEPASDTSDLQRFDEMYIHLTPRGASVPYNLCFDPEGNIWVATKGGLFKFDGKKKTTLWERKNMFPKKMAAFPQVVCHKNTIIYTCGEDKDKMTEMRFFALDGTMTHESFVDGLLISLVVGDNGDIFVTKQPQGLESVLYRSNVETPLGWDSLVSSEADAFQTLCVVDDNIVMAAMSTQPVTMYSKQRLVFVDVEKERIVKSFSSAGKEDGHIFFPRSIRRYGDKLVVLDKAGRFLRFNKEGKFVDQIAEIDAYLANGFCIRDDAALMALSGVVLDQDRRTICDDWLEWIALDGSSWKKQRQAAKAESLTEAFDSKLVV